MTDEIRIPFAALVAIIRNTLTNLGVPGSIAEVEAQIMAEADLLGVPSHGIRMLPGLALGIREGRANPKPHVTVRRERAATCLLDGDNGPGRYVSAQAMQHAIERAKQFGVGICLATRVTHWGRAHAYADRAARAGCVGICTTNAIPNMLAYGSAQPLLGNNPLAIGVPNDDHDPIVLDMAMSQAAVGKVGTFLREGKSVPAGWGLDANGAPTSDPAAILSSGKVLPLGDHKGAGLALMMELLTGALAGAWLSFEIGERDHTGLDPDTSKFFLALDVAAFTEPARFAQRVAALRAFLRNAEPGLGITFPGERGWEAREKNLRAGVPLHRDIVAQLEAAGIRLE